MWLRLSSTRGSCNDSDTVRWKWKKEVPLHPCASEEVSRTPRSIEGNNRVSTTDLGGEKHVRRLVRWGQVMQGSLWKETPGTTVFQTDLPWDMPRSPASISPCSWSCSRQINCDELEGFSRGERGVGCRPRSDTPAIEQYDSRNVRLSFLLSSVCTAAPPRLEVSSP